MSLIQDIIEGEIIFPCRFSNVEERDYGLLYWTTEIPDSHDGNHACILHAGDLDAVVADVDDFYRRKRLTPRAYHISEPGEGRELRRAFEAAGFQVREHHNPIYIHERPSRIKPVDGLAIRRVESPLPELLAMIEQSDSPRAMKVVRRSLTCPTYHLLVGFHDGQPVAMAAVERAGPVDVVDDVLTHCPFRGRGYARALIHELVRYHAQVLSGALFLYTDNPTAARIYEEAGFEKLDAPLERWTAWKD